MTILDIVHILATAEKAIAEGHVELGLPMAWTALHDLGPSPAGGLAKDLGAATAALRMRDVHALLYHLRRILELAPSVYGSEAAEVVETVRAAG